MRALRIELATEGAGLAEVDLDKVMLVFLVRGGLRMLVLGDVTFGVELFGSNRGKLWGGADTRRDADSDGMELDRRLFTADGNGTGVAFGDRDNGRI